MSRSTKEIIQYGSAVVMLMSGIIFCAIGLLTHPVGEIHSSVLWYTGQVMVYAGSAFGIAKYVDFRIDEKLR